MSVLACNRKCCDQIMCDRYSYTYGYICNECFSELVSRGVQTDVGEFMDTKKSNMNEPQATVSYFDTVFPLR